MSCSCSQINSFLYACVSVPPSSLQHSRAKLLFLRLKLFCWLRPLSLLMLLLLLLLLWWWWLQGNSGLGIPTSRLSENVKEEPERSCRNWGYGEIYWMKEEERSARGETECNHWVASAHCLIFHTLSPSYTVWLNSSLLVYSALSG